MTDERALLSRCPFCSRKPGEWHSETCYLYTPPPPPQRSTDD